MRKVAVLLLSMVTLIGCSSEEGAVPQTSVVQQEQFGEPVFYIAEFFFSNPDNGTWRTSIRSGDQSRSESGLFSDAGTGVEFPFDFAVICDGDRKACLARYESFPAPYELQGEGYLPDYHFVAPVTLKSSTKARWNQWCKITVHLLDVRTETFGEIEKTTAGKVDRSELILSSDSSGNLEGTNCEAVWPPEE